MDQMKRREFVGQVAGIAGMVGLGSAAVLTPKTAEAQTVSSSRLVMTVQGFIKGVAATGTMAVTQFLAQEGKLFANGTATLTDAAGVVTTFLISNLPVDITSSSCESLTLTFGLPSYTITFDGFTITLQPVTLNILVTFPNTLLGQLLCAIASYYVNGTLQITQQLLELLNRLIRLVG
jgi:hypothetical protein